MYRDLGTTKGSVRVTRRIEAGTGYDRHVIASEGEIVSLETAYRRGIPGAALEPVGPAGVAAFARLRELAETGEGDVSGAVSDADATAAAIADAEAAADRVRRERTDESDRRRSEVAGQRAATPPPGTRVGGIGEFPAHRGGNWWTLSNGEKFQGTREAAEQAEVEVQAAAAAGGEPGATDSGDPTAEPQPADGGDPTVPGDPAAVETGADAKTEVPPGAGGA